MGVGLPRRWLPSEVRDEMDQALLDYPPVVIASKADPSGKLAEASEVLSCDLSE